MPEESVFRPEVDYVLLGEADHSLVTLVEALNRSTPLSSVHGLYYKEFGTIKNTLEHTEADVVGLSWKYYSRSKAPLPKTLGDLPYPAWHIFPLKAYWHSEVRIGGGDVVREKFAVMVSTRGCPHSCYFCTSPLQSGFKAYRTRSNEDVVSEIRWLIESFSIEEVMFLDDNFSVSKPRVKRLLVDLIREFPTTVFSVPAGTEINAIDNEIIDLIAAAHFHKVSLAVESGNQEIQNSVIDKNVKLDRVHDIVQYINSKGIETRALFMIGFPGETREQIMRTIDMANTLEVDDFYVSLVTPLPGTPLYDQCLQDNILEDDFDVNNLRYSVANIKLPDMTRAELEELRRSVWQQYQDRIQKRTESLLIKERYRSFEGTQDYEMAGVVRYSGVQPLPEK